MFVEELVDIQPRESARHLNMTGVAALLTSIVNRLVWGAI
jgi:hypothetical protein